MLSIKIKQQDLLFDGKTIFDSIAYILGVPKIVPSFEAES